MKLTIKDSIVGPMCITVVVATFIGVFLANFVMAQSNSAKDETFQDSQKYLCLKLDKSTDQFITVTKASDADVLYKLSQELFTIESVKALTKDGKSLTLSNVAVQVKINPDELMRNPSILKSSKVSRVSNVASLEYDSNLQSKVIEQLLLYLNSTQSTECGSYAAIKQEITSIVNTHLSDKYPNNLVQVSDVYVEEVY